MPPSPLPTYTHSQLLAFFNHIRLPNSQRIFNLKSKPLDSISTLRYLALLQKLTLITVPFENLSIHYSESHNVDIDPQALWEKIVGRGVREQGADEAGSSAGLVEAGKGQQENGTKDQANMRKWQGGRGGYCMENNCFFGTILRSIGFDVYSAGARVKGSNGFTGWSHMVNLVRIHPHTYHVDIGFGGGGPTHPIPLLDPNPATNNHGTVGQQTSYPYLASPSVSSHTSIRLIHRTLREDEAPSASPSLREQGDVGQALWVYEMRRGDGGDGGDGKNGGSGEWEPQYCFSTLEFFPVDFELMNLYTSTSPRVWFTQKIVVTRFILEGDDGVCLPSSTTTTTPQNNEDDAEGDRKLVESKIVGQMILHSNVVKRRIGDKSEVVEELQTEEERARALEKWFGIRLTRGERRGIRGMVTELGA